jgi:hypothetical protein
MDLENQLSGFADPQRLDKIDKLTELGIGEYISLPQVYIPF